jgi:hypothetical protein
VKRMSMAFLMALSASGCAGLEKVQPWQREYLSRPEMNWSAGLVEEQTMRDHTYVSKEAATGGATIGGGGCGCN